jgi:hypothetical protein
MNEKKNSEKKWQFFVFHPCGIRAKKLSKNVATRDNKIEAKMEESLENSHG